MDNNKLFSYLKIAITNKSSLFSKEIVKFAHEVGYINAWEQKFFSSVRRWEALTENQIYTVVKINEKILARLYVPKASEQFIHQVAPKLSIVEMLYC